MVPPPLRILPRKYANKEPARTGFNQGLLQIGIKNNFENKRCVQGPSITVSHNAHSARQTERSNSREPGRRIQSRENSAIKDPRESSMSSRRPLSKMGEPTAEVANAEDRETVHVVQQSNHETSLRHFFYLEYKKKFEEGKQNPIVYSRFGKAHYASEEQFDNSNFNQLVRTCNLKKLLRAHEQSKVRMVDRFGMPVPSKPKFSAPAQLPTADYYNPRSEKDTTLVFESRFESGNLQLAHK